MDNQASPYLGKGTLPFPVVLNKMILIVLVFILNSNAWKLKRVASFSAITDFHHVYTHFVKNLYTFYAFVSRHISREKYILSSLFSLIAVKHALYMRRAMWFPATIELKKKNQGTKIKTIAVTSMQNLGTIKRRRLCMGLLYTIIFVVEKFKFFKVLKKICEPFETRFSKLWPRNSILDLIKIIEDGDLSFGSRSST